jgi:hypothetical protein
MFYYFTAPFKGVKKLYLKDDGLPVPRSTAYKRKQASKTLTFKDQAGKMQLSKA